MYKKLELCNIYYRIYDNGIIMRDDSNRIIKPHKSKDGYLVVNVGVGNNRKCKYVHRLVAQMFVPFDGDINKLTVNHKDYNKENNQYLNLEWVSREYNSSHSYKQKTHLNIGSTHRNAKLDEKKVREIKLLLNEDLYNINDIAIMFDVNIRTIRDIKYGKTWKRVII